MKANNQKNEEPIVYGIVEDENLLFIPKSAAIRLSRYNLAVNTALDEKISWGEFEEKYPDIYQDLFAELFEENFNDWYSSLEDKMPIQLARKKYASEVLKDTALTPLPDMKFELRGPWIDSTQFVLELSGYSYITDIIPSDILDKYAVFDSWVEIYRLKAEYQKEILTELSKIGILCTRDDDLVNKAIGLY
jgi:hypothetical protein